MSIVSLITTIRKVSIIPILQMSKLKEVKQFSQSHIVYKGSGRISTQACLIPKPTNDIASLMVFISDLSKLVYGLPYSIFSGFVITRACVEMRPPSAWIAE